MGRVGMVLLTVLTLAAVAIAAVLVYAMLVREDPAEVDRQREQERREARRYFEDQPNYACTLSGGTMSGETIAECEARAVRAALERWEEAGRPEPSSIELYP